ncbi:hypothetical protein [Terriglobus albidus]|uniref:hypothetical protein n=1 Tax=Terriglobus albidus TaxID=1592106 RepID=UPI0021DF4BC4|nr:hypothetical protein [Terriglobus albidus]
MADVTAEFVQKILDLAPVERFTIHGLEYSDTKLNLVAPPTIDNIAIGTLKGFVDLLEADFEGFQKDAVLIHVVSHDKVRFIAKGSDGYGRRQTFIEATAQKGEKEFKFDTYYSVEDFNISLRALFVQSPELDDLISLASKITQADENRIDDDGISQKVTAKTGVGPLVGERVIKPTVKLKPYRTFREVDQPASEYVFRVKQMTNGAIGCALFEADGGTWKLTAISTIADWLTNRIKGSTTPDLSSIPVIA